MLMLFQCTLIDSWLCWLFSINCCIFFLAPTIIVNWEHSVNINQLNFLYSCFMYPFILTLIIDRCCYVYHHYHQIKLSNLDKIVEVWGRRWKMKKNKETMEEEKDKKQKAQEDEKTGKKNYWLSDLNKRSMVEVQ